MAMLSRLDTLRNTEMPRALLTWILISIVVLTASEALSQPTPEISSFRKYYALSDTELSAGQNLRLKGFVLCYDPDWNQLYVHDGDLTAYIDPKLFRTQPQRGQRVEITGRATLVGGSRAITNLDLTILGPGPQPPAKRLTAPQLASEYGQWIETSGRVRVADTSQGRLVLYLQEQGQPFLATVMGALKTNDFKWMLDCNVRLRAINGSKIINGRLQSAQLTVPSFDDITIIDQPGKKALISPVVSIGKLLNRELGSWTNNRVHISGVMSAYRPGEHLIVSDVTGSIRSKVIQVGSISPGTRLDVWGFLTASSTEAYLADAYFEIARPALQPIAFPPAPETALRTTNAPKELTRVDEIRDLPRDRAALRIPVRLRGVITFADTGWRNCFFQDESGGIYVKLGNQSVAHGRRVELTGETDAGGYAPQIINPTFQELGATNLPAALKVDLDDLVKGHLDAQWVELQGVVRRVIGDSGHAHLVITTPMGRFKAVIPLLSDQDLPSHLIDALVSVQGACTTEMNSKGQLAGVVLNVPTVAHARVLESPPADPFEQKTSPVASVGTFQPERLAGRRIKVEGVVTFVIPWQGFYLQDASGGIRVHAEHTNEVSLGDRVDVVGFPVAGNFSPQLEDAVLRKTGTGLLPLPMRSTAEQILLHGTNDSAVVEIEAQLLQSVQGAASPYLVLQDGSILFNASLSNPARGKQATALLAGSRLRLTGVCAIQAGENREPNAFRLLLRQPGDIKVLTTPPWWTPRHTVFLASSLVLLIALALVWAIALRRTVQRQTAIIHQELQTEESLKLQFRELFENAKDLMFTFDLDGKCTSLNQAAKQFFDLSHEQALEKCLVDFVAPDFRALIEQNTKSLIEGESVASFEVTASRSNGAESLLEVSLRTIQQGGRPLSFQATAHDLTERRELENDLRQSQKMESIGRLAAGVAHDFNNILTIIQGHCDFLQADRKNLARHMESINEMTSAAERAANLTRQLLMFSRKQPLRPTQLEVNQLISQLAKMLQRLLGEQIHLECSYGTGLPTVLADAVMIEQVVINLSVNARDAMPSGGRLTIRTEAVYIDSDHVRRNPESRAGQFVSLAVEDIGHGMDEATMKHLFEPFFTTKEVGKGTGLGLASVYGILKQHQGWVEVASKPNHGSRFTLFLPGSETKLTGIAEKPATIEHRGGTETILLVEDEPDLRALVSAALKNLGYRVLTAGSGLDAIPVWEKHKSEIDLLFTDQVMPDGISGRELAERFRSEKPALSILFTSGYSVDIDMHGLFKEGVNFLPKPYGTPALAKLVRDCLDRKISPS